MFLVHGHVIPNLKKSGVDISINWPSIRNWQIKELDSWKATQLNLLHQKIVKYEVLTLYTVITVIKKS